MIVVKCKQIVESSELLGDDAQDMDLGIGEVFEYSSFPKSCTEEEALRHFHNEVALSYPEHYEIWAEQITE